MLSLSFPLLAWYAFKQLNQTYQDGMVTAAKKQAEVIKQSLLEYGNNNPSGIAGLVPENITAQWAIDGNDNEWQSMAWHVIDYKLRFKLGQVNQSQFLVLIEAKDRTPQMAPDNSQDRLVLALGDGQGIRKITIPRQAEGRVYLNAKHQAYWHETADGYVMEMALVPGPLTRLGIAMIDHNAMNNALSHGHIAAEQIQLQPLFQASSQWQQFMDNIKPADGQIKLSDPKGRLLYQSATPEAVTKESDWFSHFLYQVVFDNNADDESFFYGQTIQHTLPFGHLETTLLQADAQITLMQTFLRVMGLILLAALLLLAGSFMYAALLVWRIKKLNQSLQNALDDHGTISTQLAALNNPDEIGDLSRGMSQLLGRINEYTDYLKQLGSRLSHEMKTPISIVHSSLEMLHLKQPENPFVSRALSANNRLKFILNQLSALSLLKQTIAETEVETFEVNGFLAELTQSYQVNNPSIQFRACQTDILLTGSKELLAQMMDKLIQNATDYSPAESDIWITTDVNDKNSQFLLEISNTGPQIPDAYIPKLFDSLTSFRKHKSEQPHLGLGLYIVKLICDFHQHQVTAENTQQPKGVKFIISGRWTTSPSKK